jgi:hypothetical protein
MIIKGHHPISNASNLIQNEVPHKNTGMSAKSKSSPRDFATALEDIENNQLVLNSKLRENLVNKGKEGLYA